MDTLELNQFEPTLEQTLTALERHGLTVKARHRRADLELTIEYAGKELTCLVELKHHLRPATIGATLQQLRARGGQPMLVADYVAPPMADRLRQQGVWFADVAGNVYLEDPPLLITLYGDKINQKFVVKFAMRPAEEGNAEILKRFWNFPEDPTGRAPAPLVYADLLANGDTRCVETADMIYKDIVGGLEQQTSKNPVTKQEKERG